MTEDQKHALMALGELNEACKYMASRWEELFATARGAMTAEQQRAMRLDFFRMTMRQLQSAERIYNGDWQTWREQSAAYELREDIRALTTRYL